MNKVAYHPFHIDWTQLGESFIALISFSHHKFSEIAIHFTHSFPDSYQAFLFQVKFGLKYFLFSDSVIVMKVYIFWGLTRWCESNLGRGFLDAYSELC